MGELVTKIAKNVSTLSFRLGDFKKRKFDRSSHFSCASVLQKPGYSVSQSVETREQKNTQFKKYKPFLRSGRSFLFK